MTAPPSFEELYSMLLNHEKRLEIYHQPSPDREAAALFVSSNHGNNNYSNDRDHGGTHARDQGRERNNSHNNRGANKGSFRGRGRGRNNKPSHYNVNVTCQICEKLGHSALTCRELHNYAQQADDLPSAFSAMSFSSPSDHT